MESSDDAVSSKFRRLKEGVSIVHIQEAKIIIYIQEAESIMQDNDSNVQKAGKQTPQLEVWVALRIKLSSLAFSEVSTRIYAERSCMLVHLLLPRASLGRCAYLYAILQKMAFYCMLVHSVASSEELALAQTIALGSAMNYLRRHHLSRMPLWLLCC